MSAEPAPAVVERAEGETKRPGPLAGLLVADFTRVLAGPYCTMLLGDLGATVVKIEGPAGDETRAWMPPTRDTANGGESTYYLSVNRNKRAVTLDFADAADLATARALAARADVVVENFKPGGLERFGLDYDAVRAGNPGGRLRVDHRLRPGLRPARLRRARPGAVGPHERHRNARGRPHEGGRRDRRRRDRPARRDRHPGGAASSRRDRRGPARRGEPAVVGAVGAREPVRRVRARRGRAAAARQRPPEHLPVRPLPHRRRPARDRGRQRRAVRAPVRGPRARRSTPGSPPRASARCAATNSARCSSRRSPPARPATGTTGCPRSACRAPRSSTWARRSRGPTASASPRSSRPAPTASGCRGCGIRSPSRPRPPRTPSPRPPPTPTAPGSSSFSAADPATPARRSRTLRGLRALAGTHGSPTWQRGSRTALPDAWIAPRIAATRIRGPRGIR